MMMKRKLLLGTAIGAALLGPASQVGATPGVGGCGANVLKVSVDEAMDLIDWRPYTDVEQTEIEAFVREFVDANNDDVLCAKQYEPNRGHDSKWGFADYVLTRLGDNKSQGR